jgi:hypothetical protein
MWCFMIHLLAGSVKSGGEVRGKGSLQLFREPEPPPGGKCPLPTQPWLAWGQFSIRAQQYLLILHQIVLVISDSAVLSRRFSSKIVE